MSCPSRAEGGELRLPAKEKAMGYWYDVYTGDDQEPRNGDVPLLKEQACAEADRLHAQGWSVCVVRMDADAGEVRRAYWPCDGRKRKAL